MLYSRSITAECRINSVAKIKPTFESCDMSVLIKYSFFMYIKVAIGL